MKKRMEIDTVAFRWVYFIMSATCLRFVDSLDSLSKMEQSYDSYYSSFDYFDKSTLLRPISDEMRDYNFRYLPGECRYIRDERGFEVSRQAFFNSWLSTAKKLIGSSQNVGKKV